MARRTKWIFTALWDAGLSPYQANSIFQRIGFSPDVADVLIKRFWHGAGMLDVDSTISPAEQNKHMRKWDEWVRDWLRENPDADPIKKI